MYIHAGKCIIYTYIQCVLFLCCVESVPCIGMMYRILCGTCDHEVWHITACCMFNSGMECVRMWCGTGLCAITSYSIFSLETSLSALK